MSSDSNYCYLANFCGDLNMDKVSQNYCIMPEQPYCPCCDFGLMLHSFEDSDEFCEWVCLLTEEKYKAYMKEKENAQEN